MKKVMMVSMVSLISLVGFSQQKITGFGRLQLGMSVKDIPELSNPKTIKSTSEYFSKIYENTSPDCYEAKLDTTEIGSSFTKKIDNERIFHIGSISITDNIILTDVTLNFYNDKLYSIEINDEKIDDLITTKYGQGKEDIKTEDHTFQNGYGAKFVKTDIRKKITWVTNDPKISCYYVNNFWYNDSGKLLHVEYCYLKNDEIDSLVRKENEKTIAKINKREEDKKKGLVSGF